MVRRRVVSLSTSVLALILFSAACSSPAATPSTSAGPGSSNVSATVEPPPSTPTPTTEQTSVATTETVAPPPATSASSQSPDQPPVTGAVLPAGTPEDVVTGLDAPWSIVFADGTTLVSERDSGRIVELTGSGTREVGVVEGVVHQSEGGLLGLAVHAETSATYLYAYFTGSDDNRIVRFPLIGAAGSFALGPVEAVFQGIPKAGNHNGGRIAFGPDGMLYVTAGDAGNRDTAQDPDSLSGKILRLTAIGGVPEDNPFAGNPMYSMGHRNPQGISWDAAGNLWSAEFGQNTWDELNLIRPGANYGWPEVEGIEGNPDFVDPLQQWATDDASPSGIVVAGDTIFIANLRGQRLRAVPVADPANSTEYYVGEYGRLRDVVVAPDGRLWILTNNTDGRGSPNDGDDRILGVPLNT